MSGLERILHGRGEFHLLGAELVPVAEATGNGAAGGEDVREGGGHRGVNSTLTAGRSRGGGAGETRRYASPSPMTLPTARTTHRNSTSSRPGSSRTSVPSSSTTTSQGPAVAWNRARVM